MFEKIYESFFTSLIYMAFLFCTAVSYCCSP